MSKLYEYSYSVSHGMRFVNNRFLYIVTAEMNKKVYISSSVFIFDK